LNPQGKKVAIIFRALVRDRDDHSKNDERLRGHLKEQLASLEGARSSSGRRT
jgi:hypothetical protein